MKHADCKSKMMWIKREEQCLYPIANKRIVVSEAKGIELKSIEGKIYLDFTGGAHVCNVGYSHSEIIKATKQQWTKWII